MFKPNTPHDAEKQADGRVALTGLVAVEVAAVRARKVSERWAETEIRLRPAMKVMGRK
jgi:hypothetical protein